MKSRFAKLLGAIRTFRIETKHPHGPLGWTALSHEVATRKRLPYEPPAIEADEVFETLALACAKGPGAGHGCGPGRGSS